MPNRNPLGALCPWLREICALGRELGQVLRVVEEAPACRFQQYEALKTVASRPIQALLHPNQLPTRRT
jgi:hypothetical protein